MRIALKISGLYCVVSELAPLIITKPITTITMLMASMMKLILPKAKFFFSSILIKKKRPLTCPTGILSPRGEEEVTFIRDGSTKL